MNKITYMTYKKRDVYIYLPSHTFATH